ncbi:MAG TPA: hypothetical protein GX517_09055 [Alicyclobacillus sp.]|nr:hypothetical protein [Alicyclobacillus sp.]
MSTIERLLSHIGIEQIPVPTDKNQEYAALRERYLKAYEQAFERLDGELSEAVGAMVEALAEMDEYERTHAFWSGLIYGIQMTLNVTKDSPVFRVG